jgi:hypothetical protein
MHRLACFHILLFLLLLASCSPDVEVYAPERELYIVYGILNPQAQVQYVTVTKVFQFHGDAYAYAAQTDLTARGLEVTLNADTLVWTSRLVEIIDSVPGLFAATTGAYRFETAGTQALHAGKRYDLRITKPGDPNFLITSYTEIPTQPVLTEPGEPIFSVQQGTYTFPTVDFSLDQSVYFDRGTGKGFELRIYVTYKDAGTIHTARWGPTSIFKTPVRCHANVGAGESCYQIPGGNVPNVWHSILSNYPDTVDFIDTLRVARSLDSLDKTAWMEITAVDSFLTSYLVANNPFGFGLNLLMDKQEFTNISGDNAGVFGSINTASNYIFLGSCTRWLMGLRGRRPPGCGG